MLKNVEIDFEVVPSNVEEDPDDASDPRDYVCRCAQRKAVAVAEKFPGAWILGADTIVVVDNDILGKPVDNNEAASMLRKLSGRKHVVVTAFCLVGGPEGKKILKFVETEVTFKRLTDEEIDGYVATGEPLDKAGAYAIQGIGSFLVKEIKGSYTNVVGLPLAEVIDVLAGLEISRPFEKSLR